MMLLRAVWWVLRHPVLLLVLVVVAVMLWKGTEVMSQMAP